MTLGELKAILNSRNDLDDRKICIQATNEFMYLCYDIQYVDLAKINDDECVIINGVSNEQLANSIGECAEKY